MLDIMAFHRLYSQHTFPVLIYLFTAGYCCRQTDPDVCFHGLTRQPPTVPSQDKIRTTAQPLQFS